MVRENPVARGFDPVFDVSVVAPKLKAKVEETSTLKVAVKPMRGTVLLKGMLETGITTVPVPAAPVRRRLPVCTEAIPFAT